MSERYRIALAALQDEVSVEIAETREAILETQRLRYVVYRSERQIFSSDSELEIDEDEFDCRSRHVALRHKATGDVIGTTRLILPDDGVSDVSFPTHRMSGRQWFQDIPISTTAEISRFVISRSRRDTGRLSDPVLLLGLMQGILRVSRALSLTHWCASMEPSLLRLLRTVGVHFEARGPMVEFWGLRQPALGDISAILDRAQIEKPVVWAFVNGTTQARSEMSQVALARYANSMLAPGSVQTLL